MRADDRSEPEWTPETGHAEALARIAAEAAAQTGRLDLSGLELVAIPAEIAELTALEALNIGLRIEDGDGYRVYHNAIADLAPLAGLTALRTLDCGHTQITDLAPLAGLTALETLDCGLTRIADLAPLAGLTALETLNCSYTPIADLEPLARLTALRTLDCGGTQIADLAPIFAHPALRSVGAWNLRAIMDPIPHPAGWSPSLESLNLARTRIRGLPDELFAEQDNHLPALRAHLLDLDAGAEARPRAKLIVLGNGRVGKTQLRRRLMGEPFIAGDISTHGVEQHPIPLDHPAHAGGVTLASWDFGGQDIYHGTHALFTRARAVYVVCWHEAFETGYERAENGLEFARRPLAYWLDFIRYTAGAEVPVILVRTRSEAPDEHGRPPAEILERLDGFGMGEAVAFGAASDRGLGAIREKLADAVSYLDRTYGAVRIGKARMDVIDALEGIARRDQARPPADRLYRTITRQHFDHICDTRERPPYDKALLLDFLHHAGDVIHHEDLFGGDIILDQSWALDAIYALFHRDRCVRDLQERAGRFTRNTLDTLVWAGAGHSATDQERFIGMMLASGMAFQVSEGVNDGDPAEYIAPDFLPDRDAVAPKLRGFWDEDMDTVRTQRRFPFLHDGFNRGVVAALGDLAGRYGEYWRWGVQFFDEETGARARLHIDLKGEDGSGVLVLETQKGAAAELQARLLGVIDAVQQRYNLEPETVESGLAVEGARERPGTGEGEGETVRPGPEPRARPVVAVSYRRTGDAGNEALSTLIPAMKAAVPSHADFIHDSDALKPGDGLNRFMDEDISAADRIGVLLSDGYLRSPYCMRELRGAWRLANEKQDVFVRAVHVWSVDGADIYSATARQVYADYWQAELAKLNEIIARSEAFNHTDASTEKGDILDFINNVGEILRVIADRVQGGTFDAYLARLLCDL